jgi:hypothetical protein
MIQKKFHLILRVLPFLLFLILFKVVIHYLGWEILTVNPLLTSLIAATTFLIGFLMTGVITDYKESEKIPNELASYIEIEYEEAEWIWKNYNSEAARELMNEMKTFLPFLKQWFYKKESTTHIYERLGKIHEIYYRLPKEVPVNIILKLKQELSNIRKTITRIHTIRETKFVQPGYTIVEILVLIVNVQLVFLKMNPFYESMVFLTLISFIVLYMLLLLKKLDNPFEYRDKYSQATKISLKPLLDLDDRLSTI